MMYAIYTGRLARIIDNLGDDVLIEFEDGGDRVTIPFGAPTLVIDPTDDQVVAARAGLPLPRDYASEREVRAEAIQWLTRAVADVGLSNEALAHAERVLAEAREKHLIALREEARRERG